MLSTLRGYWSGGPGGGEMEWVGKVATTPEQPIARPSAALPTPVRRRSERIANRQSPSAAVEAPAPREEPKSQKKLTRGMAAKQAVASKEGDMHEKNLKELVEQGDFAGAAALEQSRSEAPAAKQPQAGVVGPRDLQAPRPEAASKEGEEPAKRDGGASADAEIEREKLKHETKLKVLLDKQDFAGAAALEQTWKEAQAAKQPQAGVVGSGQPRHSDQWAAEALTSGGSRGTHISGQPRHSLKAPRPEAASKEGEETAERDVGASAAKHEKLRSARRASAGARLELDLHEKNLQDLIFLSSVLSVRPA